MSNGDDVPTICCAGGICCDLAKAIKALGKWLAHHVHGLHADEAKAVATKIHESYDMAPKGLLRPIVEFVNDHPNEPVPESLFAPYVDYLRAHPYE